MEYSFLINSRLVDGVPTIEQMTSPGAPYLEHACMLGLMNHRGSNSLVRIKSVEINEVGGRTTTTPTALLLRRISALTGGEALTPIPFDSTSAAIPSQVSIVKYPALITSTGTPHRYILALDTVFSTRIAALFGAKNGASRGSNILGIAQITTGDSDVQGITLREGEGFSIDSNSVGCSPIAFEIMIFLNIGTATYQVSYVAAPEPTRPIFAIMNAAGSGVVITLARVVITPIRTADVIKKLSLERFTYSYGGEDIVATSMDSTTPALDSKIQIRKNCVVTQANADATQGGLSMTGGYSPLRSTVMPYFGKGPALASGALARQTLRHSLHSQIATIGEIVLREGEGAGLFQKVNFSGRGDYEAIIIFTSESTGSPSGGGEHSSVF